MFSGPMLKGPSMSRFGRPKADERDASCTAPSQTTGLMRADVAVLSVLKPFAEDLPP